jgi:hypothetical protein
VGADQAVKTNNLAIEPVQNQEQSQEQNQGEEPPKNK